MSTALVWFRHDLRLDANPAFSQATADHDSVAALVVLDERLLDAAGTHRRTLFLANVASLAGELADAGGELIVRTGRARTVVPAVVDDVGADALYWNDATSGFGRRRDAAVEDSVDVPVVRSWGTLVTEPGSVLTKKGTLSRVFTPFARTWANTALTPLPEPGEATLVGGVASEGAPDHDEPPIPAGSDAAHEALAAWLEHVDDYERTRDLPAIDGTSGLSAHLRFGTISPRTVLEVVGNESPGRAAFVRQLAWRDWYAHLLVEMPAMVDHAVRPEYDEIVWRDDPEGLAAWQQGRTGYPLVDAGMRQLAATGWMHNRVRMVVGSFLVKDLLIDWRHGERWFRRLLIDGEPSQNAGNWQWVAGTGTDAAPYFRVFNPVSQSQKFDPEGSYIKTWVPELAGLDKRSIHAPWDAAPLDLAAGGVILGDTYPEPIVDHGQARDRVLAAYKRALGKD